MRHLEHGKNTQQFLTFKDTGILLSLICQCNPRNCQSYPSVFYGTKSSRTFSDWTIYFALFHSS